MEQTTIAISASRVAALVGAFDRSPAYAGLAEALRLLIGEGQIPASARLPSERELTAALGVSRTTVTRAYAALSDIGYAESRHGSGTYALIPGGRRRTYDRALLPLPGDHEAINLNCAAQAAPVGLAAAYAEAAAELPAYLSGHGYFPAGLPELQAAIAASYDARGLPTDPEQIMVTPGALCATAIVASALTRTGDRVLVESPVYPNATGALRRAGARLVATPVDQDGWDLNYLDRAAKSARPRLAYLVPDFQNPTGNLMPEGDRAALASTLAATDTVAIIDEAHQGLALDRDLRGREPSPFAWFSPTAITIGSASKSYWGGLRLGWIRAPRSEMKRLMSARIALDLGTPVMEQLTLLRLLAAGNEFVETQRDRILHQRDALAAAMTRRLPEWSFRLPWGGLALWCQLPEPAGRAVAEESERLGVIIAPGPTFTVDEGLDRFVRIPWTLPAETLTTAVDRIADAWASVQEGRLWESPRSLPRHDARVIVA